MKTAQRRNALDSASPPGDDARIPVKYRATCTAGCFVYEEWNQSGRIPVLHRPSLRSATMIWLALTPFGSRGTGAASRRSTSSRRRGGLATPRRTSSAAASSINSLTWQGSSRATGSPRWVISTLSPRRTSLSSPLRPFFASLTLARFTWLSWPDQVDLSSLLDGPGLDAVSPPCPRLAGQGPDPPVPAHPGAAALGADADAHIAKARQAFEELAELP